MHGQEWRRACRALLNLLWVVWAGLSRPAYALRGGHCSPQVQSARGGWVLATGAAEAPAGAITARRRLGPAFSLRLRGGAGAPPLRAKVSDEDIVRVLAHMLAPDSGQIRSAEDELDEMVTGNPIGCIEGLLTCMMREGAAMELRQLAAIVLRRRIGDMWDALTDEQQRDVQLRIGNALVADLATASSKLRRLLALCMAAVTALSSTQMQLDAVVERILSAAANATGSPSAAAVAIETLEMLVESMAYDLRQHIESMHEVTLGALQCSHSNVRLSGIRLSSSLLMHSLGRSDAAFSSELVQLLHSLLVRAVDIADATTVDCILVSLTEVVPFCWGQEACCRTDNLLKLALNVTAGAMPLAVREHASLFVVELAQCQPHVLEERGLFGMVASSLTAVSAAALVRHVTLSPGSDFLLRIARGEDVLDVPDRALERSLLEKRLDILKGEDGGGVQDRAVGLTMCQPGDPAREAEAEVDMTLRALRLVLQSDGAELTTIAFVRELDVVCSGPGKELKMVRLVLVRACCDAALATSSQEESYSQVLHSLNLVSPPRSAACVVRPRVQASGGMLRHPALLSRPPCLSPLLAHLSQFGVRSQEMPAGACLRRLSSLLCTPWQQSGRVVQAAAWSCRACKLSRLRATVRQVACAAASTASRTALMLSSHIVIMDCADFLGAGDAA